jgi:hypothetical protein
MAYNFKPTYEGIQKNLEEVKTMAKKKDNFSDEDKIKVAEKTKYLFYGALKSLVDIGNRIIFENDYRRPLNNADVFISLAEHDIILSSIVPNIKKAVLAMPRISGCGYNEFFSIVSESMADLCKCLDLYAVFFHLKDPNK